MEHTLPFHMSIGLIVLQKLFVTFKVNNKHLVLEKRQGEQCQHRTGGFRKATLYLSLNTLDFVDVYKFMTCCDSGKTV